MFKNITRYVICKCFKLQTAAVTQLDFLNEKKHEGSMRKSNKRTSLIYIFLTWK